MPNPNWSVNDAPSTYFRFLRTAVRSLFALCCVAAPTSASADTISLAQALALAEQHSPRLRSAGAIVEGARSSVVTAQQYPNPEVDLTAGRSGARINSAVTGATQSMGIAQTLDLPGVRDPRRRAAEAGLTAADHARNETRLALLADVRHSFFDVLRRRAELDLAESTVKLLEQVRKRVEVRVRVGEAARYELLRADAETLSAVSAAESARLRVDQALARLRAATGAPLPYKFTVEGELPPVQGAPDIAQVREQMLVRHPSLAQARSLVAQARARLETERALRTPQPSLRAGVDRDPELQTFRIGIAIPLPLWNRREGQIGESMAALTQAEQALELRRIELESGLESAYARHNVTSRQILALEGVVKQAEAALTVAEAAYRFGERGILEVIDAQRILRSVRHDFLAARYDRQSARIEIEHLRAADLEEPK